jgi:hypothetical protein
MNSRAEARSHQNLFNDFPVNVRQTEMAALKFESELCVINSEAMENCGVEVVNMDGVPGNVVAIVIRLTIADPGFDSGPSHPQCETSWMMIPAVVVRG